MDTAAGREGDGRGSGHDGALVTRALVARGRRGRRGGQQGRRGLAQLKELVGAKAVHLTPLATRKRMGGAAGEVRDGREVGDRVKGERIDRHAGR